MLKVNQLIGFGAAKQRLSLLYLGTTTDLTDRTTYTFSGQNVGAPSPNRLIVIGLHCSIQGSIYNQNSVTVGGSAATLIVNQNSPALNYLPSIYAIRNDVLSSADIVVTFSGTTSMAQISIWNVLGVNTVTAYHTLAAGAANPATGSLNIPGGGVAIGLCRCLANTSFTWTGLTEIFDTYHADNTGVTHSAASLSFQNGETGRTITAQAASGTASRIVAASWGPPP